MALNKEQLLNIHMMQKIYVLPPNSRMGKPDQDLRATKVTRVGSKFFYTEDGRKWELETGREVSEYSPAELFISEKLYNDEKEKKELWKEFYEGLTVTAPKGMSLESIKEVVELYKKNSSTN